MADVVASIESLLGGESLPRDGCGALLPVARLLDFCRPSLLLLVEENGRVLAAATPDPALPPMCVRTVGEALCAALAASATCRFAGTREGRPFEVFGVRLARDGAWGILGGAARLEGDAGTRLASLWPALVACGETAWTAVRLDQENSLLRARVSHLSAKQGTLEAAHTEAIIQSIRAQELRLREERERLAIEKMCIETEAANRAKSRFLAHMSHEIRTPLNAILGFAEILRKGGDGGDEAERQEYLDVIYRSGQHLLELINDVLDLSKIEAGQMTVEWIECSPHEIVASVASLLRVRAREKGIGLRCEWPGGMPARIRSDPVRLRQLLVNLVGNAVKFTDRGGVRLVTRMVPTKNGPQIAFDVVDTGIGIAPDKIESIFDAFVQADNSVTREFGGTGLGLAISRQIARALGGDVTVRSAPGEGSTFTATIDPGPLDGVEVLASPPSDGMVGPRDRDARDLPIDLSGARVLLVEDGRTNRKLIGLLLSRAGAAVATAENGRVGMDMALAADFDAILMDMQMPVMDGYTAATQLRQRGVDTPIIALTAYAMAEDEKKCRLAGCSGFLSKPIESHRLLHAVAECLPDRGRRLPTPTPVEFLEACAGEPLHGSALVSGLPTDDPDFREIVEEFVEKLHRQVESMRIARSAGDRGALAALAHWLKGSGGTAGFDAFTDPARRLEQAARQGLPGPIRDAVDAIERLAARVVAPGAAASTAEDACRRQEMSTGKKPPGSATPLPKA
jgi:signal transduction histidine kinase/CheY-like chemotaxis protein/HPt (histidine-containing phosphotransfer) domain-containing protein